MARFCLITIPLLFLITTGCFDPARIIITNDLEDRNIECIYVSSGSEDEWGINSLPEWKVLLPGESLEITVLPDTYDIQVVDDRGNTYTIWDRKIAEDDYLWEVLPADID
ncbi:MAG: hypothetical protein K8S62_03130 [Candidatus Sabulitectum sp.]|nr:hypothetical protein [Candidatus Sabulitectum sp.]